MKILMQCVLLILVLFIAAIATAWAGLYDVAADVPHAAVTEQFLKIARSHSVAARADGMTVPDLDDAATIRAAAGNYAAMCAACHLAPGVGDSELRRGLYPQPPNLSERGVASAAQAFWVIKHGIKMTGMPAWGRSVDDASLWGLVAFIRQLPRMSPEQYHDAVVASGGHHHGGGSDGDHHHVGAPGGTHDADGGEEHEHGSDHDGHDHGHDDHDHDGRPRAGGADGSDAGGAPTG